MTVEPLHAGRSGTQSPDRHTHINGTPKGTPPDWGESPVDPRRETVPARSTPDHREVRRTSLPSQNSR